MGAAKPCDERAQNRFYERRESGGAASRCGSGRSGHTQLIRENTREQSAAGQGRSVRRACGRSPSTPAQGVLFPPKKFTPRPIKYLETCIEY
jgi:hypothetical protein